MKTKIEGGEIKRTPTSTKTSGEVVDLLAALQRSVDAAKTARGEDADEKPAKKTAARRLRQEGRQEDGGQEGTAAKKAAAKKAPAKKAAKKAPARKAELTP